MVTDNYSKRFGNIYKDKRILVTGHTGFKGAWLSIWLNKLEAEVVGYALEPPTTPNLFNICSLGSRMTSIKGDVRDLKKLKNVFENYQPEIVFHMAAQSLVRYSYREPVETYETNIIGTVNVLEICRKTPSVKVIVNVTSDKCYENREWVWGYRENDPMGGYDPYSSSKGCAELVTSAYLRSFFNPDKYREHGVSLASVRAGNVIGGGDWAEDRLIADCIRALSEKKKIIVRNPDAVRPWQHVLEPLSGYLLLAQHLYEEDSTFSGAWNFGPDDDSIVPVRWVVDRVVEIWGANASWKIDVGHKPHEARYLKLDYSKARTQLGWKPKWELDRALDKTIGWYKAYYRGEADMLSFTLEHINSYEDSVGQKKTV